MSKRHPVVAVTGSSGAGTSTVKRAFEHIFAREDIVPAVVEGDSYHRFERMHMKGLEVSIVGILWKLISVLLNCGQMWFI